ncbi:T9SS type A sorting domain-containing protein [Flavihumibacter rivuli]|uniref:T9SS type A sorting domain-containing protein n=1 Tax=Flavihumibacter rivuli TaxID=2838156 RepID=UPI001BDECEDC|nr:T9SS type A sorting domain-containing protein [Flavihumibacter rivuli]ULQ56076.1 T9SS type A sorting domain-containing protein [Flavihumibacter rivuli]
MNLIAPCPRNGGFRILLSIVLTLAKGIILAQVTLFPKDNQLYPRNLVTNNATISVSGSLDQNSGFTQVRLKKFRDGILVTNTNFNLSYSNNTATYNFTETIPAELNNYRFDLFGFNGTTETLIQSANNVVAGDVYIIEGQSNAVANWRSDYTVNNDANTATNAPYRNFVRVWGSGSQTAAYTKAWFIGNGNIWYENDGNTGQWGMRMASNIAGSQNVPICIMNGGHPGAPISFFQRNDANPTDLATNYGRLLNRMTEAGLRQAARGIIWYQGESDALGSTSTVQLTTAQWKQSYTNLYQDWKTDYPGVTQFYIIQTRFGCGINTRDGALQIQEAQRQLALEIPDLKIMTSNNLDNLFDGGVINYCHYLFENGYKVMGDWMTNLLRRDLYGVSGLPSSISPPEPKQADLTAFAPTGEATQVTLTLKDPNASYTLLGDLIPDLRLEGGSYSITGLTINADKLIINFTRNTGTTTNPSGITYLSHQGTASPVLHNNSGVGLVYFSNFPISAAPPPPPPPPPACTDPYEPNNSSGPSINLNTTIKALISNSTDQDWFKFRTQNPRYLKISLFNLPADYDVYLYDSKKRFLAAATTSGTSPEVLLYTGISKTQYQLRVIGKNGAFNATTCYSLKIEASSTPWTNTLPATSSMNTVASPMEEEAISVQQGLQLYPNPAISELNIRMAVEKSGNAEFRIIDMTGRQLLVQRKMVNSGPNTFRLNVSTITPGIYLLQIINGENITTRKITIGSR